MLESAPPTLGVHTLKGEEILFIYSHQTPVLNTALDTQ